MDEKAANAFFLWLREGGRADQTCETYVGFVRKIIAGGASVGDIESVTEALNAFLPSTHEARGTAWRHYLDWQSGKEPGLRRRRYSSRPNRVSYLGEEAHLWMTDRKGVEKPFPVRISKDDAPWALNFRWSLSSRGGKGDRGYAITRLRGERRQTVSIHRLLMGEPEGAEVDHIDGDKLNNTRENLRVVTRREQTQNVASQGASGHRNVQRRKNRWEVKVTCDGKQIYGGRYESLKEAVNSAEALREEVFTHPNEERSAQKDAINPSTG